MIFVALSEAAQKGELILVEGGMCRWHKRRDGVVVIREILVLPDARRKGVGREMVRLVMAAYCGAVIQAKCPVEYEAAQSFWQSMGFVLAETIEQPNGKRINRWIRQPSA